VCIRVKLAVASAVSAEFWGARARSRASRSRTSLLKTFTKGNSESVCEHAKMAKKLQSWTCPFVSFVAFCGDFWR